LARDTYSFDGWSHNPLAAEFTVYALEPGQGRTLLVQHSEKNLAARCGLEGDEPGPVAVTLQPAAAVVGRLLADDGRPLAHGDVTVQFRRAEEGPRRPPHAHSRSVRTDAAGKFRIDGLLAGLAYRAEVRPAGQNPRVIFDDVSLRSGETKDVGDVKPKAGDSQ
jgi:hypothetical protein